MVECPRCGLYISGLESECGVCGYQPNWEDYYDYDLIDDNCFDKILKYNSCNVVDIVHSEKQIDYNILIKIFYCPICGGVILPKSNNIFCDNCGHQVYLILNQDSLWQEILNEHVHYSLDFVEKYKLDNFWYSTAKEYYVTCEFDKALLCFDKALELNKLNGDALFYKMNIYDSFNDEHNMKLCRKEMFKCYNNLLKLNPKNDRIWNKKGLAFYNTNQFKRAINCFNKAIKYNPTNHYYWNNKGDCYYYNGDYDLALECFDNAIQLNEFSSYAWYSKAYIFKEQKNHHMMLKCFDKVIEFNQNNNPKWYYYRAYHSDDDILREYVMKCDKEMGNHINYLFVLKDKADFYYNKNDYEKAEFYYTELLEFDYGNEEIIELLEDLYW